MERLVVTSDPFANPNPQKVSSPTYTLPKECLFQTPKSLLKSDENWVNNNIHNSFQDSTNLTKTNDYDAYEDIRSMRNFLNELDMACTNLKTKFIETNSESASMMTAIEKLKYRCIHFTEEIQRLQETHKNLENCLTILNTDKDKFCHNCIQLYNENKSLKRLNHENFEELERQRKKIRFLRARLVEGSVTSSNQSTRLLSDSSSGDYENLTQLNIPATTHAVVLKITLTTNTCKKKDRKKRKLA